MSVVLDQSNDEADNGGGACVNLQGNGCGYSIVRNKSELIQKPARVRWKWRSAMAIGKAPVLTDLAPSIAVIFRDDLAPLRKCRGLLNLNGNPNPNKMILP